MAKEMIKRKDGSYSQRGLWDNIRANKGSGKKPTKQMLKQEKKIKAKSKTNVPKALFGISLRDGIRGITDPMSRIERKTGMSRGQMLSMGMKAAPMLAGMPPMKKGGSVKSKKKK